MPDYIPKSHLDKLAEDAEIIKIASNGIKNRYNPHIEPEGKAYEPLKVQNIWDKIKDTDPLPAIPSGLDPLDTLMGGGFWPRRLCVLGASTGVGKTTILVNLAYNMALKGVKSLFIANEADARELSIRIAVSYTHLTLPTKRIV